MHDCFGKRLEAHLIALENADSREAEKAICQAIIQLCGQVQSSSLAEVYVHGAHKRALSDMIDGCEEKWGVYLERLFRNPDERSVELTRGLIFFFDRFERAWLRATNLFGVLMW